MSRTREEIFGQYAALEQTLALSQRNRGIFERLLEQTAPKSIVFMGCGSSYSLSCSFRSIASLRARIPVYAFAAGDLWLHSARCRLALTDALVISVSRSGRTSELINACRAIREMNVGARLVSVVCAEDTPLEEMSLLTVKMPWAFDDSVCQTRCVSNLYAMGALIIGDLFHDGELRDGLTRVAQLGPDYLNRCDGPARRLAEADWDHAVVLADGEIDGLAEEGALAFKEICRVNSNCYHVLDVRHGPIVLIRERTLVLAAFNAPVSAYERALLAEIRSGGALLAVCSDEPVQVDGAVNFALGAKVAPAAAGLGLAAVCQLISCARAEAAGFDPDAPEGLKPWVDLG